MVVVVGRRGEVVEEPCEGFFIVAIMQKVKAGRLYNLLVTAHRNAESGQRLSRLRSHSQERTFYMCRALTSCGMMAYSCTSRIQKNTVNYSLAIVLRIERVEGGIIWHKISKLKKTLICHARRR